MHLSFALSILIGAGGTAQVPSAPALLERCQRAYDSVRTFEEDVTGTIGKQGGTAHISFSRPGRLRVTGKSMFRSGYDLLVVGSSAWVLNGASWDKVQSPEMGVAAITGISANAGTTVPALLLHTMWGSLAGLRQSGTTVARERIGKRDTFRLSRQSPLPTAIWLDARTSFLVRTSTAVMGRTIRIEFSTPVVNRPIPPSRYVRK